jgi:hypothetical protein
MQEGGYKNSALNELPPALAGGYATKESGFSRIRRWLFGKHVPPPEFG